MSQKESPQQRYRERHREKIRVTAKTKYHADLGKSREYARNWQAAKYRAVAEVKLSSGCVDCGFKASAHALQFDHLPQFEKLFNIGPAIRSKSKESVLAEIAKCEVRCANCHAVKTALRRLNG